MNREERRRRERHWKKLDSWRARRHPEHPDTIFEHHCAPDGCGFYWGKRYVLGRCPDGYERPLLVSMEKCARCKRFNMRQNFHHVPVGVELTIENAEQYPWLGEEPA